MRRITYILLGILVMGCVKDRDFETATLQCSDLEVNTTYQQVKSIYKGETIQIQKDLTIEGYVISSDQAGNFFGVLYFQDKPSEPTEGFQIELDLRDIHLFYPIGSKIVIRLKGLYLGKSKDVFKIGGVFTSFGNASVGRLPATVVRNHILTTCDGKSNIEPRLVSVTGLTNSLTNTLVRFPSMEISLDETGAPFAITEEETERSLVDCEDNELILLNSGYSDFQNLPLPVKNGSITGVLLRENDTYRIAIRSLEDIDFNEERCAELIDEFRSDQLFISELADPDNNSKARFVELYNAASESLDLKGWTLNRYTNANTEISSSIDLSDFVIEGKKTLVISPNMTEFETVYGFLPNLGVGTNSPADSNGDDTLELVDPFGTVVDIFGVIGEDGTGTNHEFEDGRALRKITVVKANPVYTPSEWIIYNDTGNDGTIDQPQNAPGDFTPGTRD